MRSSSLLLPLAAAGVLLVLSASTAEAQRPGGFGFGGFGIQSDPISLLRNPNVRRELEIEEDQTKEIDGIREKMDAELNDERRKIAAKYLKEVEKVLQPQQVERLRQISLQARGVAALTDKDVATKLELSQEQIDKINQERTAGAKKLADLRGTNGGRFDRESLEKMQEIQQETNQAVLNVLSDNLKAEYEKLKGKPFDFGFGGGRKKRPDTE